MPSKFRIKVMEPLQGSHNGEKGDITHETLIFPSPAEHKHIVAEAQRLSIEKTPIDAPGSGTDPMRYLLDVFKIK